MGSSGWVESASSSSGSSETATSGMTGSKSGNGTTGSFSTGTSSGQGSSGATGASVSGSSAGATGAAESGSASATTGSSGGNIYDAGGSHRDAAPVELAGCAAQVPTAIFGESCEGNTCHNSKDHQYDLDLQSPGVAARLVNQPSLEIGTLLLIDPNNWSQSFLLLKVEQSQPPAGSQMPQQGTKLNSTQIACLQQWVEAEAAGPY
jgi:hypothetical protein